MQKHAPEAVDFDQETDATRDLYGIDGSRTDDFGRKCLLARRLVERGVRFIQVYSGGAHNDDNWDAHAGMERNHTFHAGNTDKPIAGLIKDLKQRGMLDETLIVWGGEFGRQPTAEYAKGTGRARLGSIRSPQWRGGGVARGPKPRDYSHRTPKKMVRLAVRSALSDRASSGRVVVVGDWDFEVPKTREAVIALEAPVSYTHLTLPTNREV